MNNKALFGYLVIGLLIFGIVASTISLAISVEVSEIEGELMPTLPILISLPKLIEKKDEAVKIEAKREKGTKNLSLHLYLEAGRLNVLPTIEKDYLFILKGRKEAGKEILQKLVDGRYKLYLPSGEYTLYLPVDMTYWLKVESKVGEIKVEADTLRLTYLEVKSDVGNMELKVKLCEGAEIFAELNIGNLEAFILTDGCEYKVETDVRLGKISLSGSGFSIIEWDEERKVVQSPKFDKALNPASAKLKVSLGNLSVDIGPTKGGY
jgi:hypothetical protein